MARNIECGEVFDAAARLRGDQANTRPPRIATLAENREVKIERFSVNGLASPSDEYADEPSHEFIVVLKGQLVLEYAGEDQKVRLEPGDYASKSPKQRTRADSTAAEEETVWIKVSYRGDSGNFPNFTGFGETVTEDQIS